MADDERVQRIYHISDIHVRLHDRRTEYEAVLQQLLEYIRAEACPSAIIVLTGDIMHTKNKLSPESLAFVCRMLRSLADLHPTFVIAGNHDMLLHHTDCLDTITPIVDALNHPSIVYCKYTGVTTFRNVHLAVSSLLDRGFCAATDVPVQSEGEFRIALYHGMVGTIRTSRGTSLSGEYKVADFDGFDAVLLGDIHKHMYLNEQKTMAYASSLCSQNFSETDDEHGVLVWELHYETPKRVSSFYHPIVNEFAHREYRVDDAHPWLRGDDAHVPRIPKHGRVRVEDQTTNRSDFLTVLGMLQQRLHTCTFLEACIRPTTTTATTVGARRHDGPTTVAQSPTPAVVPMRALCAEYLARHGEAVATAPTVQKTVDMLCAATEQQPQMGTTWTIESMRFRNLMGYGGDALHSLDFDLLSEPIVGIFAPNSHGKSSLFDIISYLLFGRMIRTSKVQESQSNILHSAADAGEGELFVRVGATVYRVYKRFQRERRDRSRVKVVVDTVHELVAVEGDDATGALEVAADDGTVVFRGVSYKLTSRFDDSKHGDKTSFASLIGAYEQFVFSNVYIPNKTKSFARGMTQTERKDLLIQLLCIPSIPTHLQSLQSESTMMGRRLKSKRAKQEQMLKEFNDDAKLELDLRLAQSTEAFDAALTRLQSRLAALERTRRQFEHRQTLRGLRVDYEASRTQRAALTREVDDLTAQLSPDGLDVLAERKRSFDADRAARMRALQAEIEGLLLDIRVERPVVGAAALDDTMTADDVRTQLDEATRVRDSEMATLERYTAVDKAERDRYKQRAHDATRRLEIESKRLVEMPHDHPLQRALLESLGVLRGQACASPDDLAERKRAHDERRRQRRGSIQAELDACKLDLRARVDCSFRNEPPLSTAALEALCAAHDEEIGALTGQRQEEREHIQQYVEPMCSARRAYKDERQRISESLATHKATLHEMERRDDGDATEDGLRAMEAEHHARLDRYTEQIEAGKQQLAQHTQTVADYARYAHDDHDRDDLQRRRDALTGVAFNPECAQCQANPMRKEAALIDERLRELDERATEREAAMHRKDEGERQIPLLTERVQQACGLHERETAGWAERRAAYLARLQDKQRLDDQRRLCRDIELSQQRLLGEWRGSDARACYKRYKRVSRTHSATTEKLAEIVEARAQVAAFLKNQQAADHNAAIHERIASLTARLSEPDDDAVDREYAQHVAHRAQLESATREYDRVALNNSLHHAQQAQCAQTQHELDELRREWRSSPSKQRYADYKRAHATHTDTITKVHRLEEQRELHAVSAHNASVRAHNAQAHARIGECRQHLLERERATYDEYDRNVAVLAQIRPKREALAHVDARCTRLEGELRPFGAADDEAEVSEADVVNAQSAVSADQATHDTLEHACAAVRASLTSFLAQRQKNSRRQAKILSLEQDLRAVDLSIEMLSERGVVACWFERALTMIQSAVNSFASPLLGRQLSFTCIGDKIEIGFTSDAHETSIPIFGGMESVVVDLAIQMALAELTRSARCNLFIIDEAFFVMDQHNRMQVPRLLHELQQKYRHVFVISHDSFIHDVIHQEIQIRTTQNHAKTIQITGVCMN